MGVITKGIIDKILFDLNRNKGKDVVTVIDLWNYFNTLQSLTEGGGGSGDMTKAVYDPANLAAQVLVEPISIDINDFADLINKTNGNGNNPSLNGLSCGQTYAISGMDNFGYSTDCIYYVNTIKNDNGDVIPNYCGVITSPSSISNNVYPLCVRWQPSGFEAPMSCVIERNVFHTLTSSSLSFDKTQISGDTLVTLDNSIFYGSWNIDLSSVVNKGINISIDGVHFLAESSLNFFGEESAEVVNTDIFKTSVNFNSNNSSLSQTIQGCNIRYCEVIFEDNTSGTVSQELNNCELSDVSMSIGRDVILSNCRFIGDGSGCNIVIPNGYTASNKTFIQGVSSNFELTIELDDTVTGNTLELPVNYRDWIGVYKTTNTSHSAYAINTIDVGTDARHEFRIYGNNTAPIDINLTSVSTPPVAGNICVSLDISFVGAFYLGTAWDYWVFQKSEIASNTDVLRVNKYSTLN